MKLTKFIIVALCCYASIASAKRRKSRGYSKAVEGQAVVLNKLFPKAGRAEIVSNFGGIINQSYINSLLLHGGLNYYFSEVWGMAVEGVYAFNSDKNERGCLEAFYNKVEETGDPCRQSEKDEIPDGTKIRMGPAYVPITELQYLFSISAIWTPVYGKQIFSALPVTGHMDIFFTIGGGSAMTNYHPLKTTIGDTKTPSRCTRKEGDKNVLSGCGVEYEKKDSWGVGGRPKSKEELTMAINLGIGQKYYFVNRLYLDIELRTYNLIGGTETFHNFFALWGGLGFRF